MLSVTTYKILHLLGILMVFVSVGGVSLHALNGGTRADNAGRRLVALTSGIGLVLILIAGFGMLAKLGIMSEGVPGWVWAKLLIWLALGGLITLPYRRPGLARAVWIAAPFLGALAATFALTKPL